MRISIDWRLLSIEQAYFSIACNRVSMAASFIELFVGARAASCRSMATVHAISVAITAAVARVSGRYRFQFMLGLRDAVPQ